MALASDYNELRLDKERWLKTYERDEKALLAGLGWLIVDTLKRYPKKPVVVMFDEEKEVQHARRQATESL